MAEGNEEQPFEIAFSDISERSTRNAWFSKIELWILQMYSNLPKNIG